MKNFVWSGFVVLGLLGPVLVEGSVRAAVVWTAGFEGNKSGDVCGSNMAGAEFIPAVLDTNGTRVNAQVLGEQVYAGKLACKVTVHPDDIFTQSYNQNRVDVRHNSTLTGEGKDMYLSGYYYLAADAKTRNEFMMFETTNSTNWMDVWVDAKAGGGTSINLGVESSGANLGSVHVWNGDLTPGTWHQIALHVLWSQDATKGLIDFWVDGKQVVTGFKHKTKPNANDLYFLTGLHRLVMQPYTETIYFDAFIEGTTQDDIKIGAPGSGSGAADGGADAAGTTGASGTGGATGVAGAAGTTGASGNGGVTGGGGSTGGMTGTTGAAGSVSTGAAGTTTGGGGATTGAAGSAATSGSAGAAGTGASHGHSSSGCTIAGAWDVGPWPALAMLGAAIAIRRRRRSTSG
jgi:hypothetical protein